MSKTETKKSKVVDYKAEVKTAYDDMSKAINAATFDDDFNKAIAGNKSARTRVRKTLMTIRTLAQSVRLGIMKVEAVQE